MKNKEIENWGRFVEEFANEYSPLEEVEADLVAAGVDVEYFLADIMNTVHTGYREASKKMAKEGIREKKALLSQVYETIAGLGRKELFKRISELAEKGNREAQVFCREKQGDEISDEDLRYLLVDFIVNGGFHEDAK